jgi:phage-related protein
MENFKIEFLKEVLDFLDKLDNKTRNKILFNIDKAKVKNDSTLFKKLNSDIWEFRTQFNKIQYRLFAFWDKSDDKVTIVVATHGIVKKSQKTPTKEIKKASEIMKEYFKSK